MKFFFLFLASNIQQLVFEFSLNRIECVLVAPQ